MIGTPRKVALDDRDKFGLRGILLLLVANYLCDGGGLMTERKAHHVESSIEGAIKGQLYM